MVGWGLIGREAMDNATLALRKEFRGDWVDDLTPLAEQLLAEAEELYGSRDRAWIFLGVQVGEFKSNVTWPIDKDRKLACICLQKLLPTHWPDYLLFNLAHETIHMLSPPDADKVTYLEEGVAVCFSLTRKIYKDPSYLGEQQSILEKNPEDKYTTAWKDVELLIWIEPNAIAKLRCLNKSLSCISVTQIMEVAPSCDPAIAQRLTRRFKE
jgi:hypothetical protein